LHYLQQKSNAHYDELAEQTGNATAIIKLYIQDLTKRGFIERLESHKTRYWKIMQQ
jgi:DNA-binding MarR family transcriptional regulator